MSKQFFASENNPEILREHPLPISLTRIKGDRHKNKIKFDNKTDHETYYKGNTAKFVVDGLDKKIKLFMNSTGVNGTDAENVIQMK